MSKTLKTKFKYADNTTRNYELECPDEAAAGVKTKIKNLNISLLGGTAGGMESFFVSNNGANLTEISEAQIITITDTILDLSATSISGGN